MAIVPDQTTPAQPHTGPATLVATRTWDEVMAPATAPQAPTPRDLFEQAVAQAARTMDCPPYNTPAEKRTKAVELVLTGKVQLEADGRWMVQGSRQQPYHGNGTCPCPQGQSQRSKWCKHRVAIELARRARALVAQQLDGPAAPPTEETSLGAQTPDPTPPAVAVPMPQGHRDAPYSMCIRTLKDGFEVQITVRKSDNADFLAVLNTVPQWLGEHGYQPTHCAPAAREAEGTPAAKEPKEGWCAKHQVQMTKQSNAKGSWWSHKTADGWCKGK